MKYRAYGMTDVGKVRSNNEDRLLVREGDGASVGLFVVADGVGGAQHGEVASQTVVDELERLFEEDRERFAEYTTERDQELREPLAALLVELLQQAAKAVFEKAKTEQRLGGMATTATALLLAESGVFIGHVGDTRAYLIRDGVVYQLTQDHTWAAEIAQETGLAKEQNLLQPYGHVLTRSVGTSPRVIVDCLYVRAYPGDRFLLCSDGLHTSLSDADIQRLSAEVSKPQPFVDRLVGQANEQGGDDNITAIVVELVDERTKRVVGVALDEQIGLLRNLFLFEYLNDQQILRVMRIVHEVHKEAGDVIIEEGTEGQEVHILIQGWVDVSVGGETINTVGVGGHFGELALIDRQKRSATVTAREDVVLLTIDQQDFFNLVQTEHGIASKLLWAFLKNVGGRVRELSGEVAELQRQLTDKP